MYKSTYSRPKQAEEERLTHTINAANEHQSVTKFGILIPGEDNEAIFKKFTSEQYAVQNISQIANKFSDLALTIVAVSLNTYTVLYCASFRQGSATIEIDLEVSSTSMSFNADAGSFSAQPPYCSS